MTNTTRHQLLDILLDPEEDEKDKRVPVAVFVAEALCILLYVLASINAAPIGYISGTNSFLLLNATKGFECFISGSLENSMFPSAYFVFVLAEGVLVGFAIIFLYIPIRRKIIKSNSIRKQMTNINIYKNSSKEEITCINTCIKSMLELSENACENNRHSFKLTEESALNSVSTHYKKKHKSFGESPNSEDLRNTDILSPSSLLSNLNGLLIVPSSVAGMDLRKSERSTVGFTWTHIKEVKTDVGQDPADVNRTSAFFQLYKFFSKIEYHERCLKRECRDIFDDKPKSYVTALLTNHLLSKLVLGKEHITCRDLPDKPLFCPCFNAVKCQKPIEYGHTGLGYEKFWYGRPDVLLSADNEIQQNCVMVSEDRKTNNQSRDFEKELCSEINEKTKEEEVAMTRQALAQCITFAFSRSNMKKLYSNIALTSTLIPTLVLMPNDYFVYMYDYEHDVLLKSGPSDLWDESGQGFNRSAILQIWMLLNHMNFEPCLSQNQVNYLSKSANFHNISGEKFTLSELTENVSFKSCFLESKKAYDMNLYPELAIY
ncbi:unnamed protein product [Mytilus coruscus]|uniref:Uncharacterized protein n=1 Tax=Mytilus coruscus TaxID=42192 RepID=A0A6J8CZH5_MYTCO|nr:unnamed protein product [Mytilus coruscus]